MIRGLIKQSLSMAWPMVASRILVAITNFYAMWFLAHLGQNTLAAGALIFVIQVMVSVVMASILFALGPIIGRAFGAKDHQKIGAVTQQGWFLSVLLTIPSVLILWFIGPILLFAHQEPSLTTIIVTYFHVYIWAIIPMFFFSTNQIVLMAVGKQRLAFLSSLVAAIVLFIVTPLATFGKLGLPISGVQGIALGMAASIWAGLLFSGLYCLRLPFFADFEFFKWRLQQSWSYLKQILMIGWPIVVQIGGEMISWFVMTLLIGWLGVRALSAQQIVNQFNVLVVVPIIGLSQASGILVGQATGSKRYHEVRQLGWVNIGIGMLMMLIVMCIYLLIPNTLIQLYLGKGALVDPYVEHLAKLLFIVSAFAMFFDAIRNVSMGALRGVYDSRYPMYLGLVIMWLIGLPLAYGFGFSLHGGVVGFALANLIAVILAAGLLIYRWHTKVHHLIAKADLSDAKHR